MRAIYLDCFAGISGNMLLGAFLQAGVPREHLEKELHKLILPEEFTLKVSDVSKNGIQAKYVDVILPDEPVEFSSLSEKHGDEHEHHQHHHAEDEENDGHGHRHDFGREMEHLHAHHHHAHRTMRDIRSMILESDLSGTVKKTSVAIFTCLAEAEGKIHGMPVDDVHFHEVGATDSIVDIVGCAICLEYLDVEKIFVSRVNTGSGFVECAHGTMMVPAPATAELLKGFASYHAADEKEMTTPTGAAVLHALATYSENMPQDFNPDTIAYGAGYWDLSIPNVLRMYLGDTTGERERRRFVLETNIDDMNPQDYGYVYERLLEAGALDVWTTPIFMKKNRPAVTLSVMVDDEHKEECLDIIFAETTTIGVRLVPVNQRREAQRRTAKVETEYGNVDCKISAYKGHIVSLSAEYDDLKRLAVEKGVPIKKVRAAALNELSRRLGE
ncbi:MAG: nickel pincer cofactor biosynthesis protein LarC [Schwartzia sp.]|nr:nickel pincer cofactor biosynthesis protein LarC [Schwartzia sp. (in: firmicutes)]